MTEAFAKIEELRVKHPIMSNSIEVVILTLIFGYMGVYTFIDWIGDDFFDNENMTPLQWSLKWLAIIVVGTAIEALILTIISAILYFIFAVLMYGYLYFIPMCVLFGGLYIGRKIYLKKQEHTKIEP